MREPRVRPRVPREALPVAPMHACPSHSRTAASNAESPIGSWKACSEEEGTV